MSIAFSSRCILCTGRVWAAFVVMLFAGTLICAEPAFAQSEPDTTELGQASELIQAYERAESLLSWNTEDMVYRMSVQPHWFGDDQFWYRVQVEEGHEFLRVNPVNQTQAPAFDQEQLAAAIATVQQEDGEEEASVTPYELPFSTFAYTDDQTAITFAHNEKQWQCDLDAYTCEITGDDPKADLPTSIESPDGERAAYIKDHNLWMRNLETGEDVQLTTNGEEHYGYATDSQGWRRSDMPILKWSPNGEQIATYRLDERDTKLMPLIRTTEGRPELDTWPYALPGDPDDEVPMLERVVINVEAPEVTFLDMEPDHQRTSSCCGLSRDQELADVAWSTDSETLAIVSTSRDYNTATLRLADATTGAVRTVYSESDAPFFESNLQSRGVPNWRVLHDQEQFIWFTKKDGWGHLYLHDLNTGEEITQITEGNWNVMDVLDVDAENETLLFSAAGRETDRDVYHTHLYRADLDGSNIELLSPESADHTLDIAPSGNYIVDTYSTYNTPPQSVVRTADGEMVLPIAEADASALTDSTVWQAPEHFTALARDGETELHGYLYKPSNFDPERSYPIINSIYPGPQTGSMGTRSFSTNRRGQAHALAELGFIVVQVDAMGTPLRSKDFHTAWYGDMADNGLPDQRAVMEQLAERHDWIDLDRVGIYGHSGGGFATAAALFDHPDFFHVGVSGAGNHDNRSYTYYWGEKYQGLLQDTDEGDTYTNQANQLRVDGLAGELMLSYGTLDDNVHPNMTQLVIDQLIEHNKDFDLLVMPNRDHGYANEPYVLRRTWDYFVEHLLNEAPPTEYEIER